MQTTAFYLIISQTIDEYVTSVYRDAMHYKHEKVLFVPIHMGLFILDGFGYWVGLMLTEDSMPLPGLSKKLKDKTPKKNFFGNSIIKLNYTSKNPLKSLMLKFDIFYR